MSEKQAAAIEPERYEIHAPASVSFEASRRDFFRFLGAGMVVACAASKTMGVQESGGGRRSRRWS